MVGDPSISLPTVAVVVPTLDEAARLPRLLDSLGWPAPGAPCAVSADVADTVIVVDGGSRDGTLEIAARHGTRTLHANRGRGTQQAAGACLADSDLLLFLHADSALAPGSLRAVRSAFLDSEVVATGMSQRIEAEGRLFRMIERTANRRVRRGWVYGDSGLAVRRKVYEAAGGFSEEPLFEDLDLSRRLRKRGEIRLVHDAELLISPRRWKQDGTVRRTVRNWILTTGWALGVAPARLERFYRPHGAPKTQEPAT